MCTPTVKFILTCIVRLKSREFFAPPLSLKTSSPIIRVKLYSPCHFRPHFSGALYTWYNDDDCFYNTWYGWIANIDVLLSRMDLSDELRLQFLILDQRLMLMVLGWGFNPLVEPTSMMWWKGLNYTYLSTYGSLVLRTLVRIKSKDVVLYITLLASVSRWQAGCTFPLCY